jgi:hypothetical protein
VNSSAGQRALVVHTGQDMGFTDGEELIYNSKLDTMMYE